VMKPVVMPSRRVRCKWRKSEAYHKNHRRGFHSVSSIQRIGAIAAVSART
jgi:hypothetical protein